MPANQPKPAESGTTGGTATPIVQPTPVLGDVQTEGAITPQGTVTSHAGPPTPAGAPPTVPILGRMAPPTVAVPVVPEAEYTFKNMLRQPLHTRTGTVAAGGTFLATAKEGLAFGKQVERV